MTIDEAPSVMRQLDIADRCDASLTTALDMPRRLHERVKPSAWAVIEKHCCARSMEAVAAIDVALAHGGTA